MAGVIRLTGLTLVVLLVAAAAVVLRVGSPDVGALPDGALLSRLKQSPEYDGSEFVNLERTHEVREGGTWPIVKEYLFGNEQHRPSKPLPSVSVDLSAFQPDSTLAVCWLGHSSTLIRIDGVTLLLDPVFDETVSLRVGHTDRFQPSPLSRDSLPHIDAVLISHDHYDHLERRTAEYLGRKGVKYIVPLGVRAELRSWNVPDGQIFDLDWWESVRVGNVELVCTPARHSSGRSLLRNNKTLWCSWTVLGLQHRLYHAGDTGPTKSFDDIGERYGPFDLTLLPIGGYSDDWPDIHLTPEQAVDAERALRGKLLLPVHWGTLDVAFHSWDEPIRRLEKAATTKQVAIVTSRLGEVVDIDRATPTDPWWQRVE
ncbi:MAG TPA: MBL fold metallo-hydrolase [candidate division Zixibacteria bacterium]|nr:MBL fold metallo-hydrolase [candidate division Zixibacteria bacterium]